MLTNVILIIFAVLVIGICILVDLNRTVTRAAFGIVTTVISVALSCVLAKLTASLLKNVTNDMIWSMIFGDRVNIPENIAEIAGALIAAFVAPMFFVVIMIVIDIILSLVSKPICSLIENKLSAFKTKNKLASGAIGAVVGLLTVAILLAPISGYATMARAFTPLATELTNEASSVTADISLDPFDLIEDLSGSIVVKGSLTFGGKLIVTELTTANIDGVRFSLYTEAPAIAQVLDCVHLLTTESFGSYGSFEISKIENVGYLLMSDEAISTLAASIISSAAEAWKNGDDFLGINSPLATGNSLINSDVILESLSNYSSTSLATDVMAVGRSIMVLYENDLLSEDVSSIEDIFSDELIRSEHLNDVLIELLRSDTVSESTVATIREKLDEILRESKEHGANVKLCDSIDAYADALSSDDLAKLAAELLPILKDAEEGEDAASLSFKLTSVFRGISETDEGKAMLIEVQKAGLKLDWLTEMLNISESEAAELSQSTAADPTLCAKMAGYALAEFYK